MENERLLSVLHISMAAQGLANHPVTGLGQFLVVQGQIHINAADVPLLALRDEQLGNPATHQDNVVSILTQNVSQLDEHRFGRVHGSSRVVYPFSDHVG
jgi:hypothetical protein